MLSSLNDDLGMDAKAVSFLISMIMEGHEKALIQKRDLDGIDLRWGNVEAAAEILKRISQRDGFGDTLAEGVMRASKKIGGEADARRKRQASSTSAMAPNMSPVMQPNLLLK